MSKDKLVQCWYDDHEDEIVIKVGRDFLSWMAENSPAMIDPEGKPYARVANSIELAKDVVKELNEEEEDGTTAVHRILDAAMESAADNGSLGFMGV